MLSTFYTRIDQACHLWGLISITIFATAQFSPLNWSFQALLWTALSLVGTAGMVKLAQYCAGVEPLNQVITAWTILMVTGVAITNLSICLGWGWLMTQLCPLWLGLNALGYLYTGLKMRSRAFFLISLIHGLGIAILPLVGVWQFLTTGLVLGLSVSLLAELQWDSSGVCNGHIVNKLTHTLDTLNPVTTEIFNKPKV